MSPRPRKASDEAVFAAAQRVMQQVGPAEVTLARIAAEAGVTAGALVQRFGSRRGLMLALMAEFSRSAPGFFAQIRAAHPSPLAALRAYAECHAQMADTPQTLAHHLSYLQIDLTDPDFHEHMRAQALDTRAELRRLLADALAAGELVPQTDIDRLTRAVMAALNGSLFVWATLREGTAAESVRADLDAVLAPYLAIDGIQPALDR
ncbi:MAG TPA: helix-turn-helix domain-containing protein [Longimicrobium sp.]|jgi:AcrR family transcriptional regulator|nr:helix-turn-helix domain-containing protein [Longimicrobium sp.]